MATAQSWEFESNAPLQNPLTGFPAADGLFVEGSGSLIDDNDATGYSYDFDDHQWAGYDRNAHAAVGYVYTQETPAFSGDGIPATATITKVTHNFRVKRIPAGRDCTFRSICRRLGARKSGTGRTPISTGWQNYTQDFTTDPQGNVWTLDSLFGSDTAFGLVIGTSSTGAGDDGFWSGASITVHFELADPVVVTDPAYTILGASAYGRATINASGATVDFPVAYYFEFGREVTYGSTTPVIDGLIGTADQSVEALFSGLSPDTVYHFRAVAFTYDATVGSGTPIDLFYGDDVSFLTSGASNRFWLDEFAPPGYNGSWKLHRNKIRACCATKWPGFDVSTRVEDCLELDRFAK